MAELVGEQSKYYGDSLANVLRWENGISVVYCLKLPVL